MFKKLIAGFIAAVAAVAAFGIWRCTRWWRTWGVRPVDSTVALPGDELIEDAQASDTRGITIAAPPEAVWPWLVQMGYGRAGWYSYDRLDMKGSSADRILPEHQGLAVGDVVPTDSSGGFEVRRAGAGPGARAVRGQRADRRPDTEGRRGRSGRGDARRARLRRAGSSRPPRPPTSRSPGRSSSAPERDGGTRLIERVRLHVGPSRRGRPGPWRR